MPSEHCRGHRKGMRLLALDVGERRIGLASGAAGLDAALPAGFLLRRRLGLDVQAVLEAAARRRTDAIVVGVPIRPGGAESRQTRRGARVCKGFAAGGGHSGLYGG